MYWINYCPESETIHSTSNRPQSSLESSTVEVFTMRKIKSQFLTAGSYFFCSQSASNWRTKSILPWETLTLLGMFLNWELDLHAALALELLFVIQHPCLEEKRYVQSSRMANVFSTDFRSFTRSEVLSFSFTGDKSLFLSETLNCRLKAKLEVSGYSWINVEPLSFFPNNSLSVLSKAARF